MTQQPFNPLGYGELKLEENGGGDGGSDERRPAAANPAAGGAPEDDPEDLLFGGAGEDAAAARSGTTFGETTPFVASGPRFSAAADDADDAWAPVEDDFVTDFAELGGNSEAAAPADREPEAAAAAAFGIPAGPVKRNLLPAGRGTQDGETEEPSRDRGDAEGAGQPGGFEPRRPVQQRQALPSTKDAPRYPMAGLHDQSRPIAWIVPALILLSGVGTGLYLCSIDGMMIVGAFAIALSVVGAPLARVLMRP